MLQFTCVIMLMLCRMFIFMVLEANGNVYVPNVKREV